MTTSQIVHSRTEKKESTSFLKKRNQKLLL